MQVPVGSVVSSIAGMARRQRGIVLASVTAVAVLSGGLVLAAVTPERAKGVVGFFDGFVVCIVVAVALASVTGFRGWVRLAAPETNLSTTIKYLAEAGLVGLGLNVAMVLLIRLTVPEVGSGFGFISIRWPVPGLTLWKTLICGPISEELLYRGFLLGLLEKAELRPWQWMAQPVFWSSLSFAVIHVLSAGSAPIAIKVLLAFVAGVYLAVVKRKSGGLLIPMLCHSMLNLIGACFSLV